MRISLIILAFCVSNIVHAQYKVVQVSIKQPFELNSAGNIGGTTRTYLPIIIPDGSVAISYAVRSTVGYDAKSDIKLATQFTALLSGNVMLAKAIDLISVPSSNATVDVFLLPHNSNNLNMFLSKRYDNQWVAYTDYTCLNSLGCVRTYKVGGKGGTLYLGLRNPSWTAKIIVTVDVVAIIEDPEQQSSYSSYNNSNNDENSAGQEYNHIKNLQPAFENTESNTNTNTYAERINYANSPSPQNGWGSKEISELTGKYGDLYLLQLRENNQSVSHKFLIEFVNCMVAYIVSEYRYEYYLMLNTAERKNAYEKSSRHCISAMND